MNTDKESLTALKLAFQDILYKFMVQVSCVLLVIAICIIIGISLVSTIPELIFLMCFCVGCLYIIDMFRMKRKFLFTKEFGDWFEKFCEYKVLKLEEEERLKEIERLKELEESLEDEEENQEK